ncbi:MAG: class I SAM-dependent methyltransferase [Candidatus Bathyarchaeota archaeon]|mgnify:FL=1|jgi:demethylmenaquinone methyltransferase/2-methoxy-6-polyprenyl-1,4-benzoquinol methylase|nr:class I SAM-dependent methyltransferase [Candidatus Bathyarchaeota archaeon]
MSIWYEVEEALEAIIDDYIRVNHLISLFQDDKARLKGLKKMGLQNGVVLELGSGPGNFTKMLDSVVDGQIICLDYSRKMIAHARKGEFKDRSHHIRGIFERLPIRSSSTKCVTASYALRDSKDKPTMYEEIGRILKNKGSLTIIDIGKPDNPIIQQVFSLYIKYIVPLIAGLATRHGYKNPWSILFQTYQLLPINKDLQRLIENLVGPTESNKMALGGLIILSAMKKAR